MTGGPGAQLNPELLPVETVLTVGDPDALAGEANRLHDLGEWIGTITDRLAVIDVETAWKSAAGKDFARRVGPVQELLLKLKPQCTDAAEVAAGTVGTLRTAQEEIRALQRAQGTAEEKLGEAVDLRAQDGSDSPVDPALTSAVYRSAEAVEHRARVYQDHEMRVADQLEAVADRLTDSWGFDLLDGIRNVTGSGPLAYVPFVDIPNVVAQVGVKLMSGEGDWGDIALDAALAAAPIPAKQVKNVAKAVEKGAAKKAGREARIPYETHRRGGPGGLPPVAAVKSVAGATTGFDGLREGYAGARDAWVYGMSGGAKTVHTANTALQGGVVLDTGVQAKNDVKGVATQSDRRQQERRSRDKAHRTAKEKSSRRTTDTSSEWPTCKDGKQE